MGKTTMPGSHFIGVVVNEHEAVLAFDNVFVGGFPGWLGPVREEAQATVPSHEGGETGE